MSFTPITLPVRSALLSLDTCSALSGEPVRALTLHCESGALRLVFDISAPGAMRCLRVAASSLAEYLRDGARLRTETPAQVLSEISALFPALSPDLNTDTVRRILNCSGTHLTHLHQSRCIQVTRNGRGGPGGMVHYSRRSVIEWLMARRFTGK
jgi:hypothetical protein